VRYALPGRRGGHPATVITYGGVIPGLRADGWQDGCQSNGLTIVMVMWPKVDYHFYRLVTGRGPVVGAQAGRYAREVHRRLRACHLPVSRSRRCAE
jgi:hypothetical protein